MIKSSEQALPTPKCIGTLYGLVGLGKSGGLSKQVKNGDDWGYCMGNRVHKYACRSPGPLQVGFSTNPPKLSIRCISRAVTWRAKRLKALGAIPFSPKPRILKPQT